ncbi:MAG: lipid A biosynthesis lauroyl acyltransferase [Arenimonas sp.]|nr:lipid A biosynthesis lauroyl acyltransferase [Arenimonas sp.]
MTEPHLLARLLYFFARLIGILPFTLLQTFGKITGFISYHCNNRETRVARRNMQLIHPNESAEKHETRVKGILNSTGQTVFETLAAWTRPRNEALKLIHQVHGLEHVQQALALGKGVLIAAPHYGNWELLIHYVANLAPLSLVYGVPKKKVVDDFLSLARNGHNLLMVPGEATAMRPLLRALQKGELVGITPDQQPKIGGGEFAAFYGHQALTLTLIAKLAQRSGAPVIFTYSERTPNGYDVFFDPPDRLVADNDLNIALDAMNQHVQAIAERDFRQYQWTYKRFSIRPNPSDKKIYS